MKNEDKIIEMLTEYIRRADVTHEEFAVSQKNIERNQLEIRDLRKDWRETQKDMKEMQGNNKQSNVRQEALMKEIFSISKRVGDLEG
jgi:uncharacterized coiled-coil DUF342 family protein